MEMDFELMTIIVTIGMWGFILFLVWGINMGFQDIKSKIAISIASLPIIYMIILWQKSR